MGRPARIRMKILEISIRVMNSSKDAPSCGNYKLCVTLILSNRGESAWPISCGKEWWSDDHELARRHAGNRWSQPADGHARLRGAETGGGRGQQRDGPPDRRRRRGGRGAAGPPPPR